MTMIFPRINRRVGKGVIAQRRSPAHALAKPGATL